MRIANFHTLDIAFFEQSSGDGGNARLVVRIERRREERAGNLLKDSARASKSASSFCSTAACVS